MLVKRINTAIFLFLAIVLLAGCSNKKFGRRRSPATHSNARLADDAIPGISETDLYTDPEARFGDGSIPMAQEGGVFRDIFFDYDSSSLSPEARMDLEANARILQEGPQLRVTIEGHCDERGTEEYNLALGEYRAKAVKEAMIALGVNPRQMETVSYGENIPLDETRTELAFAKNRRVHIAVAGDSSLRNDTARPPARDYRSPAIGAEMSEPEPDMGFGFRN